MIITIIDNGYEELSCMSKRINKIEITPKTFGARVLLNGKVEFNLWAPDSPSAELCLFKKNGQTVKLPMEDKGEGWYFLSTDQAQHRTLYKYAINDGFMVPDPASRYQPEGVHGPSQVVDPRTFNWEEDYYWKSRPWQEAVIYELHIGTFTKEGTYKAVKEHLPYLKSLGITAIELLPVASFPGVRNWGYDGVSIYAPQCSYGAPDDLKDLVKTAHEKGIMVFLDVVYNHFGPEGNYLYCYAKSKFFNKKYKTPWGDSINFKNRYVRDFFINNALYWLEEYHFDGLRFDAIHAIRDKSKPDIVEEIGQKIKEGPAKHKNIHLILENDGNNANYLRRNIDNKPELYSAQWNDDFHHCLHIITTGEKAGYYADYTLEHSGKATIEHLARSLTEGFAYQGEISQYRDNEPRGEDSTDLNPTAFINFLQNHDMIGNRAFGDRIVKIAEPDLYRAAICLFLLCPSIPMLYMGEEWGCETPFLFFCDFGEDLADSVRKGRRKEFARFPEFKDPKIRNTIPDPQSENTFKDSILNMDDINKDKHKKVLDYYKRLLLIRHKYIVPVLPQIKHKLSRYQIYNENMFSAQWEFGNTSRNLLKVIANFNNKKFEFDEKLPKNLLAKSNNKVTQDIYTDKIILPKTVVWFID